MSTTIKRVLLGLVIGVVIMQFFQIDKTQPPSDPANDFMTLLSPPDDVAAILKRSCYDCHSYKTQYPWYTSIAPLSWWIGHHIEEGREHLNFSEWGKYTERRQKHKLEECWEEVEEGKMPLDSYLWVHGEAKLSEAQATLLIDWFKEQENAF